MNSVDECIKLCEKEFDDIVVYVLDAKKKFKEGKAAEVARDIRFFDQ